MKQIPNFPLYFISESGDIYSTLKRKIMKPYLKDGYILIKLHNSQGRHNLRVHRLVALTYIPNPDNLPDVNHKDGNKNNNNISNLEWVSPARNLSHAFDMKLRPGRGKQKVNKEIKLKMEELWKNGISRKKIGEQLDVSTSSVTRHLKSKGLI